MYNIGKRIYGNNPKQQRDKWIKEGTQEYLDRVHACLNANDLIESIRDDLSHVEAQIIGSKTVKHKQFRAQVIAPTEDAVRTRLEQLVCNCFKIHVFMY